MTHLATSFMARYAYVESANVAVASIRAKNRHTILSKVAYNGIWLDTAINSTLCKRESTPSRVRMQRRYYTSNGRNMGCSREIAASSKSGAQTGAPNCNNVRTYTLSYTILACGVVQCWVVSGNKLQQPEENSLCFWQQKWKHMLGGGKLVKLQTQIPKILYNCKLMLTKRYICAYWIPYSIWPTDHVLGLSFANGKGFNCTEGLHIIKYRLQTSMRCS